MIKDDKGLRKLSRLARGRVFDVGFNDNPNPYLDAPVGLGCEVTNKGRAANCAGFAAGDCQRLSEHFEPGSFDTVIAAEIIEHLENPSQFLRECKALLKEGGVLLISTPNPYNLTTVLANALFIRGGVAEGHINLFPFRNMLELLRHCGLECRRVLNATGGTKFLPPPYNRYLFLPMVKSFCWQLIYVVEKAGAPA